MSADLSRRLNQLAADGNLDVEDVQTALRLHPLDDDGRATLGAALATFGDRLEPAARQYVEDLLAGRPAQLIARVLLAPVQRGERPDRYQPRAEVIKLQDALTAVGFPARADGDYGPGTTRAVAALQASLGVAPTGVVDAETLVRLNLRLVEAGHAPLDLSPRARVRPDAVLAMKNGANADDNRAVQAALSTLAAHFGEDAWRVSVDGQFGPRTEAAVSALQRRWYLPETGIVDGATVDALNAALAVAGQPPLTLVGGPMVGRVELHFYPGDHELKVYVLREGRVLDTYGMVGGRDAFVDDARSAVDYSPTPKGRYEVIELNPHASSSWPYSYVPYGAPLREVDGEVEFRDATGAWRVATGPKGVFAGRDPAPLGREAYFAADGTLAPMWLLNDFGHLRGRIRNVVTRNVLTHMIHTSPDLEATSGYFADTAGLVVPDQALRTLRHSHGCAHVHPRDIDELVAKSYLAPGTTFVVHGYDERFTPCSGAADV